MNLYNLRLALRVLYRQKAYAIINILGFALGIAVFFYISLFIIDQLSYDSWPDKKDQIYRLEKTDWAVLGTAPGPYLRDNFPAIEMMCRISTMNYHIGFEYEDNLFAFNNVINADSSFFDIFSFPFIAGNPSKALTDPYSIVLTESMATTMFGTTDVLGRVVRYNDQANLVVTGVIEDVSHFHLTISAIVPFPLLVELFQIEGYDFLFRWDSWNFFNFFLVAGGTDMAQLTENVNNAIAEEYNAMGLDSSRDYFFRPLNQIYFATDIKHTAPVLTGQRQTVRIFLAIAIFILLIAIVNFINLSTARSALRAREVGIRRLLGSSRLKLIGRFLTESVLITAIAVLIALVFLEIGLPWFRSFTGISLGLQQLNFLTLLTILVAGTLVTGLFSGIYPSVYLTTFAPVEVLKGQVVRGARGAFLRKALIVFQFVISIGLISATMVISRQLHFMRQSSMGINIDNSIVFRLERNTYPRWDAFKARLKEHPGIIDLARSAQVPGFITWQESAKGNNEQSSQFTMMNVDADYLKMVGVETLAGRLFSEDYRSEHRDAVLLNEKAVKYFGYEGSYESILGQPFDNRGRIIGITPDFQYNSLHNPVAPLVIRWDETHTYNLSIIIDPASYSSALSHIESVWREFVPGLPFVYYSLPEVFSENYKKEKQLNQIFMIFSGFAVIIACLGLFGLSSFMAERRMREMAVRKVMGASMNTLVLLLLKDFLKQVLLAFIIATPIAYVLLNNWLDSFAFRITISPAPFIVALLAALLITVVTVSWHSIRVSMVNPGEALKYE